MEAKSGMDGVGEVLGDAVEGAGDRTELELLRVCAVPLRSLIRLKIIVRRVLSVRGIPGVVTRCCRDARVGGRGCSGCWPASAGSVVSASPGWAGGSRAVTGLLLI